MAISKALSESEAPVAMADSCGACSGCTAPGGGAGPGGGMDAAAMAAYPFLFRGTVSAFEVMPGPNGFGAAGAAELLRLTASAFDPRAPFL